MKKYPRIIVVTVIIVVIVGGGLYYWKFTQQNNSDSIAQQQTNQANLKIYSSKKYSFQYPNTIELSKMKGFEGGFDRAGRLDAIKGDFDYLPEIQFIDNADRHIVSFGTFKLVESLKIGNYNVSKKVRDWEVVSDKNPWGAYPACVVQYHILDSIYVFCDGSPESSEVESAIKTMMETFQIN